MANPIQRSFSAGEISPALYARSDTVKYATGLRTLRNFYVRKSGGADNRPGDEFVGEVKDSSKTVRLIPFVFNNDQTYILEFGDQYMRVVRDGGQVTATAQNISGITNASTAVLTYSGADNYANGDIVYISGIVGPIGSYLNGRSFKVAGVDTTANTFQLNYLDGTAVNSTSMGAYTSGGTVAEIYTISTPYVEADLPTLQFVQSADVITIVHPSYAPRALARTGHTSWTLSTITFAPSIAAPTGLGYVGAAGGTNRWVVTAIDEVTGEESLPSDPTDYAHATIDHTLSWDAVSGASGYNIYRENTDGGQYFYIGSVGTTPAFYDGGLDLDLTLVPPVARNPFDATGEYPSAVNYFQQRLCFGRSDNDPERIWVSRTGHYNNMTKRLPIQDDDAFDWLISGRQVNEIKHILDLNNMVVMTPSSEVRITGDASGAITPIAINAKTQSYNGSSDLSPIIVDGAALYVQARGSIVRDLGFDYQVDGYRGNDLTVFSDHLVEGYELVDWTYQKTPNSIVWAVRDDGKLLSLTYQREQQILGWALHDTDGTIENVCAVPEGSEDALYLVVKRTINGATKRYIERMATRFVDDIVDYIGMDCAASYDGRNATAVTMTLSGGTNWTYSETLTCTASSSAFAASDVGKSVFIDIQDSAGRVTDRVRCKITGYTGPTIVSVKPHKTVPAALRSSAKTTWALAVTQVSGLWHLEGEQVSVLGDGHVVANPNNAKYNAITVASGAITLDKAYAVVHVGLPITADLETLDVDQPDNSSLAASRKHVSQVHMHVHKTRGLWVGAELPETDAIDTNLLTEPKLRNEEGYDDPVALRTGVIDLVIPPEWNSNGRVSLRQSDPLPASLLSIVPTLSVAGG